MKASTNTKKLKFLTQTELRRLLDQAKKESKRDYAIFLLAYRHGLRASEVGLLHVDDVDFSRRRVQL